MRPCSSKNFCLMPVIRVTDAIDGGWATLTSFSSRCAAWATPNNIDIASSAIVDHDLVKQAFRGIIVTSGLAGRTSAGIFGIWNLNLVCSAGLGPAQGR